MATEQEILEAIKSPKFSHARAGDRLYRHDVLIYHRRADSPSGVWLACAGPREIVDRLLSEHGRTSALSPTEGRSNWRYA